MLPDGITYKTLPISVAEKIIADVSTGIYRTPAAAIKELLANAYDADATAVSISTGAPHFAELVVRDNGSGMSLVRFLEIMQHIGGSWKRISQPDGLSPLYKRPLIGRIGIGLLAVAQLGQRFYVSSSLRGENTRFLAEVDLSHFHKDDAALRSMINQDGADSDSDDRIEIGLVRYVDGLPEKESSHFTVITVPDPKQGLISEMYGELRRAIGAEATYSIDAPAPSFEDLVSVVQRHKRADSVLDGYFYVMWELGLLAPVRYLGAGAFIEDAISIEGLGNIHLEEPKHFDVTMDGYEIRRPIRFPNPVAASYGGPPPKLYPLSFEGVVAGRRLAYEGYIYVQKPHIDPVELQGLQIRIRGVGIGPFDRTWMGYPFDEGIKFGQIMGEIFVNDGLESSLNIDRASFRETDPHYLTVRAKIWEILRTEVFPDFKSRQEAYRKTVQRGRLEAKQLRLAQVLERAPEPIGASPRTEVRDRLEMVPRRQVSGNSSVAHEDTVHISGERQRIVEVIQGEVVVDDREFRDATRELKVHERQMVLNICAIMASYGLWDDLDEKKARDLLSALAMAVAQ